ncbi:protein ahpA [Aspergillus nidulans FGSC A4]|uniref:Homeobox domain-containing protein n=2 Tax=Emericella nidulans TaxID=162425 RepID=C8VLE8_EMENI|nr:protein ahpA [Aspergillus nidulans FGSC A4]AAT02761.1 AhpA [Aspergillus nidulans]CBF86025.1 TPA: AhpA [Source:UniProtKB/TrEMBL;Acc:Q5J1U2] [Aspergillus nidulans FGSC A4]
MPPDPDRRRSSNRMAIPYATGLPADNQPLPSFRELLPPHLHEEIESTSYFNSQHNSRQPRERPASSHELGLNSVPREHASSRSSRPSPVLPPIRDLQSYPDRATGVYPDPRGLPPPPEITARPVGPHGYPHAAPAVPGPLADRNADAYRGVPPMHGQVRYHYPSMAYQSDPDHASVPSLSHAPQSNFGILGDSTDARNRRRRGNLPKPVTEILKAWFHAHLDHPYPSEEDKQMLMSRTGLTINQISNWFINARRRHLPALRNQRRTGGSDLDERQSLSDMEQTSPEPSPHRRL